jgi:hypothetical protein
MAVTYGVRRLSAEVDRAIDLRYPDTQAWFLETFVPMELESERRAAKATNIFFPPKKSLQSFKDLLPIILSRGTSGMAFGQAVGQWLRRRRVNALIFPSGTSNTFNRVASGQPVEWHGWSLVDYEEAEDPVSEDLFGHMMSWRDPDHNYIWVDYTANGNERGSFSIRGVREYNLLDFDFKKQVASGVREENAVKEITGINSTLSRIVNRLLENERDWGALWYNDIDYYEFVHWLEQKWRDRIAKPH